MVATALDLTYITAAEAAALFRTGELSPVELTLAHLERIEALQPLLRAYATVTPEIALREARSAEAAILRGDDRPLLGVPVAYKDIYTTAGVKTTGGSMLLQDYVPEITATTVEKLHAAGMVMLGKLTTHEFAAGLTPEDHPLPPARNPWNTGHIPGGSSSGSGAALAAGLTVGALGTDTGGSIRNPGSFCGIAALKPTYGRCSRYGVYTLSWSLDHTGPMTRTVEDCALMLNAMAGYDARDPASARVPLEDFTAKLGQSLAGTRIGVLRSWYTPGTVPPVAAAVDAALDVFRSLGATVTDVEISSIELVTASSAIMMPEAFAYHEADLRATPEMYAAPLRNRFLTGGLYLAHEYVQAQRARAILKAEVADLLHEVDLLVTPTTPTTAPTFEQAYGEFFRRGPHYTSIYNMTGLPALSVPCGFDDNGLPIGLQIAGRPFAEATVLQAGHAYERETDWHRRHPSV
jgi:aspartyl-tRNA(Asn)/glutamyl-tRNA(Gln) amidotransferase subunit A